MSTAIIMSAFMLAVGFMLGYMVGLRDSEELEE